VADSWPTPREIPSIPGVAYTVEACPFVGHPWLFFYRYLEVACA
jgi:hypothetical protein